MWEEETAVATGVGHGPSGLQVHTARNIVTADGLKIKKEILEGILDDRLSKYR